MLAYQERVVEELTALTAKREKLGAFFGQEAFVELPADERMRMHRQFNIMVAYEDVLKERIKNFPKGEV